jgi:predicted hydrocarbon binding protein
LDALRPSRLCRPAVWIDPMLNVKAVGVLDCRKYITDKFGPDAHEKIRTLMSERDRDIVYSEDLSPLSWVDLEAVVNHAIAMDKALGNGDGQVRANMLRELASNHYRGIYRIMFQSAGPKQVVNKLASIWNRYYDKGESSTEFLDDNHAIYTILDCPDVPRHHEILLIPYMESVLTLAGVRDIRIKHTQCAANGAERCVFDYSWK